MSLGIIFLHHGESMLQSKAAESPHVWERLTLNARVTVPHRSRPHVPRSQASSCGAITNLLAQAASRKVLKTGSKAMEQGG